MDRTTQGDHVSNRIRQIETDSLRFSALAVEYHNTNFKLGVVGMHLYLPVYGR